MVSNAWYQKNKQRIIRKNRSKKQSIDGKIYCWKLGAKRRNIEWNVTKEFIKSLPLICHYTGQTLTLDVGFPNTLSIDRVDSSKPYCDNNIVPCGSMVNRMKSTFNKNEFLSMCKSVAEYNT